MGTDKIVLTSRLHPFARVMFAAMGLFALLGPLLDLRPWAAPFLPFGLVFWIITLGAIGIGVALLSGAVLGESTEARIGPDSVQVIRKRLWGRRTERLSPADVTALEVVEHDWESRPHSYIVKLSLPRGRPVASREYADRADAEALARALARLLGRS